MGHLVPTTALGALVVLALGPGCTWVSSGQFSAAQTQNRILTEQSQAQLAEIENLKAHNRTVENQLIQAEEELAELDQRIGVDRKHLANFQRERRQLRGKVDSMVQGARGGAAGPDPQLEQLSRRYDWLRFDPETGISRFDADVLFDSGQAELRPDARDTLDELVRLLKSPQGGELRIMIVGHTDSRQIAKRPTREKYPDNWHLSTARALAVADYLKQAGVADEQLGVAGYGRHQPISSNASAGDREQNRRVEIFVMGPETPVVGWTESMTSVY